MKAVKSGSTIDGVKKRIQENLDKHDTTSKFKEALDSDYVSGTWVKPLLLLLEYFYKDDSNQSFIPLDNKTHIEHILPQNPKDSWQHFSDKDKETLTNALGNLTLLSGRKNTQASNRSFEEKKDTYMKQDGKATSFELTRKLFEYPEWNIDNLKARQKELISDIIRHLAI